MKFQKIAVCFASAFALVATSLADFDGPAPLAWRWSQGSPVPSGSPLYSNGLIYVAAANRVYGIDAATGNNQWQFPKKESLKGNVTFAGQVVDAGDLVIVKTSAQQLYGIEKESGSGAWSHALTRAIMGDPVYVGSQLVMLQSDGKLMALDAKTGDPAWSEPLTLDDNVVGQITGADGNIFCFSQDSLVCIKAASGKVSWKKPLAVVNGGTKPVVAGSYVYAVTGSFVTCFNIASGRLKWQRDMGSGLAYWPSISGDTISVLDREGYLQSVDLLGKKLSREPIDIGGTPVAAPTTLAGLTCVVTANGSLKLFNSRLGKTLWSYLIPPTVARKSDLANDGISAAGAPIEVGNSLVVLARDGSLLCFDKSLGVDMTAPEVKLLFPNPGEAVSGRPPLPLFFKVTDDGVGYDPATVTITIDGVKIAHERTREGYYFMAVSEHGPLLPLKDGRRTIIVTVTDYLGNTSKEEFSLVIDNQLPPITLPGTTAPVGPVPGGGNPGGGGGGGGGGGRGRGGGG